MESIEIRLIIFKYLSKKDLLNLSLVNKLWSKQIKFILFKQINLSTLKQIQLITKSINNNPLLVLLIETLTLTNHLLLDKLNNKLNHDEINANEFITFLNINGLKLKGLNLRETSFNTLRRRQLDLGSSKHSLTSLIIFGRRTNSTQPVVESGFNLHTIGSLLVQLPQLLHLGLRNIQIHSTALLGLPLPIYQLNSLALIGNNSYSPIQYRWLFRSTSHAESLKHLTLEFNDELSPRSLNGIRYLVLRVVNFTISTNQLGTIEAFVAHFPSLRQFRFRSTTYKVDINKLVENLELPLWSLIDYSSNELGIVSNELITLLSKEEKKLDNNLKELKEVKMRKSKGIEEFNILKLKLNRGIKFNFIEEVDLKGEDWISDS